MWNIAVGAEIPGSIINGLLSAKKYAAERICKKEIVKFLWSHTRHYYSNFVEKKKPGKVISVLKEDI